MPWMLFSTVLAYFVKGLTGFANTLIFSTLLSFTSDNVNISPVELIVGYPANVVIAWRERKKIVWRTCLPVAGLVLLGNIPGVFLLKTAGASQIKLLFGAVIVGLGAEMLLRERKGGRARGSKALLVAIGLLSGLLCGLYGIGALLAAYMSRVTDEPAAFRGNLCVVFLIENTFRLILYTCTGILTWPLFTQALCLFLGIRSAQFLPERVVKRVIIVLLILSGLSLIVGQL